MPMNKHRVTVTLRGEAANRFADYKRQPALTTLPDSIILETLTASALDKWAKENPKLLTQPDLPQGESHMARVRRENRESRERQHKVRSSKKK